MRHYLCGWFTFDLLTCFPSDWLYLGATIASGGAAHQLLALGGGQVL